MSIQDIRQVWGLTLLTIVHHYIFNLSHLLSGDRPGAFFESIIFLAATVRGPSLDSLAVTNRAHASQVTS